MQSFWEGLPRPFFVQAPLEDVTDAAFRQLIARLGKIPSTRLDGTSWRGGPDVMFTEFTSADGIVLAPENGRKAILKKLLFSESERPIVAQLFSAIPERMEKAARLCADLKFDGIDINMGCPDRSVEKSGCGAALMKNPALARELICAAQSAGLPVSVKTRIGYDKDELDSPPSGESGGWLPELLAESPAAITIHARTRREMSDVPAHWDAVARAVAIRNQCQDETLPRTLIVGNGDVKDLDDARVKATETGCDGVMLGRALYGNPWLFAERNTAPGRNEKIQALIEHIWLFDKLLGDTANFATMKKHFKAYISGWPAYRPPAAARAGDKHGVGRDSAKELRLKMMGSDNARDATTILSNAIIEQ